MQVIYTSPLIERPVSAVVSETASLSSLYTIAKVVLRAHDVRPIFYGLLHNGCILPGDSTPVSQLKCLMDEPLYLEVVIPDVVKKLLKKPLEKQLLSLERSSAARQASRRTTVGKTKTIRRSSGSLVRRVSST